MNTSTASRFPARKPPRVPACCTLHAAPPLRFRSRAPFRPLTPNPPQLETNERVVYDKKRKLKQAIESGKPIPTELREEEAELRHQIEMDDANTEEVSVQCW